MFKKYRDLSFGGRLLKFLLGLLIALNLAFIFVQSTLPPEISQAEVDEVKNMIGEVIPSDAQVGELVDDNITDAAHFIEFGVLGILVSLYVYLFSRYAVLTALLSPVFACFIACIDETIQIFSGRVCDANDVLHDVIGFCVASLLTYGIVFLFNKLKGNPNIDG